MISIKKLSNANSWIDVSTLNPEEFSWKYMEEDTSLYISDGFYSIRIYVNSNIDTLLRQLLSMRVNQKLQEKNESIR